MRKLKALPVCGMIALGGLAGCTDQPLPAEGTSAGVVLSLFDLDVSSAAIDYTLTSFDVATRTLSGFSKLASVCDHLSPVDPCRTRSQQRSGGFSRYRRDRRTANSEGLSQ